MTSFHRIEKIALLYYWRHITINTTINDMKNILSICNFFGLSTAIFLSCTSSLVYATNGINLIGFGTESLLMGGADIAVARDTSALNTNPAGLYQIKGKQVDIYGSLLRTTDLTLKDNFGNEEHASNRYTVLGGGGYASALDNLPCTAGVGFFAQGGSGGVFENLNTAFGTVDEFSALFGIAKLTTGIGCQVNDQWALGGSFGLVYATAEQELFPDTPNVGLSISGLESLRTSFKLGMQYKATPSITLAATYTDKTELPLSGGKLKFRTAGGDVTYRDVKLTGLALPREIGLGAAYQLNDDLLLSLKLNWVNWANAIEKNKLTASDPDAPSPVITSTAQSKWHNQWVIATGLAYDYNDKTTLYAGYNYGKNPIPQQHTTPLVAGIFEHHVTFGAAYQYNPRWKLSSGIEYDVRKKVDYTNPELPFGPDAQLRNEAIWLHFMATRTW